LSIVASLFIACLQGLRYPPMNCFDTNRKARLEHENPCVCSFRQFIQSVIHIWWILGDTEWSSEDWC